MFSLTLRNLAVQDAFCLAFHTYMWLRVMVAPDGPEARSARLSTGLLLACTIIIIFLARGEVLQRGRLRACVYRVGLIGGMPLSYFTLRDLLPALRPTLLDAWFLRIDEILFGATPARMLERFVTPASVEWFSFFYYSYFALTAVYALGTAFFDRGRRQQEMLLGAMLVCIVGHTGYTLFPGVGPYATMTFSEPLRGGFFWRCVEQAVSSAGAVLDIFPSLHTASPVFFALHAFRHREALPFRYAWHITAFFAFNMVIATLFLRWHYAIDVVAGLLLAACAQGFGVRVAARESEQARAGRQPVWESL